jgi:hypothetical protein
MLYVIIPLSVVLLGVIVYFALSRRSSKIIRLSALGALGAIMLSIIICAIIVFAGRGSAGDEPVMPDFFATEPLPAAPQGNFLALFFLALFLLALLGSVTFLSLKERKRQEKNQTPTGA